MTVDLVMLLVNGLLVTLASAFLFVMVERVVQEDKVRDVAHGITFGVGAMVAMTTTAGMPGGGALLDLRALPIGLAAAFAGGSAPLVAGALAIAFRVGLGGNSVLWGVGATAIVIAGGATWRMVLLPRLGLSVTSLAALGAMVSTANLLFIIGPLTSGRSVPTSVFTLILLKTVVTIVALIVIGRLVLVGLAGRITEASNEGSGSKQSDQGAVKQDLYQQPGSAQTVALLFSPDEPNSSTPEFEEFVRLACEEAFGRSQVTVVVRTDEIAVTVSGAGIDQVFLSVVAMRQKAAPALYLPPFSVGMGSSQLQRDDGLAMSYARTALHACRWAGGARVKAWPPRMGEAIELPTLPKG